jgi:hypothetical protein
MNKRLLVDCKVKVIIEYTDTIYKNSYYNVIIRENYFNFLVLNYINNGYNRFQLIINDISIPTHILLTTVLKVKYCKKYNIESYPSARRCKY